MIGRRALVLGLGAVACSRTRSTPDAGPRVVSLSPSTTEAVAAVGALGALVGRSRFCDHPREVLSLPDVGGYVDPNLEAIVALSPTLVVGARGPAGAAVVDALTARGVACYFPRTESLAEIDAMIVGVGDRLGRRREADAVVATSRARRDEIAHGVSGRARRRVLLLFGIQPIVAAGSATFPAELLALANADNVVVAPGYPTLDLEALRALDPDVILDAAIGAGHGAEPLPVGQPGWRDLAAVRRGAVVDISDEAVLRPGPRIADGLATLARAIHGRA